MSLAPVLEVRDLTKVYGAATGRLSRLFSRKGANTIRAVDGVSFTVGQGEVLGVVGESGCGKSTLGRMVAGLVAPTSGQILHEGRKHNSGGLDRQMIFQDPFSSLNPRKRVADLIGEAPKVHRIVSPDDLRSYVDGLMERCGIDPDTRERFAHQFSGGQRQRIGIARALAVKPGLIVCDEAVSALDVSIQSQIVNLFMDLREEFGLTYLFISHDLGVVRHVSDRVIVMYLGKVVEAGPADELFSDPQHPYTRALIEGVPRLDRRRITYTPIVGEMPSPLDPPSGCPFHPRCPRAIDRCRQTVPVLRDTSPGRQSACHLNDDI